MAWPSRRASWPPSARNRRHPDAGHGTSTPHGRNVMSEDLDQGGPIDYLVVEVPGNRTTGEAFPLLIDLGDRGLIRILDPNLRTQGPGRIGPRNSGHQSSRRRPTRSRRLRGCIIRLARRKGHRGCRHRPRAGQLGRILVYENVWAAPFATALRRRRWQRTSSFADEPCTVRRPYRRCMAGLLLLSPVAMLLVIVALDRCERRLDTDALDSDADPLDSDTAPHPNS